MFPSDYFAIAWTCQRSPAIHNARLETLYCPNAHRGDPAVNFRSPGVGTGCEHYQTSPSRQSQVISAVVSRPRVTGRTNRSLSSSGVRDTPAGARTDVGPFHGSQPRAM